MPNNFNPAAKGASPIVRGKDDDTSTAARWGRRRLGRGIVLRPLLIVLGMLLLTTAFPTATSREQPAFPAQLTTAAAAASSTTTKNEVEFRSSFRPEKSKPTSTVLVPPDYNVLTSDPNNQTVSDSCGAQTNCSSCNTEHLCHWCSADRACHAMGSPHGCWRGASCDDGGGAPDDSNNHKNASDNNTTNNTSCDAHTNCIDCGRASKLCHWCAHDNACHELGSVHGCLTGVNCYDNAHCQRAVPEPLIVPTSWSDYQQEIGWIPLIIIATVAGACLCCLTLCCCVASGVKGAYDDLAELAGGHEDEAGDDEEPLLDPSMSVRADPPAARATEHVHTDDGASGSTVESQEIVHENEEMQQRLLRDEPSGVTPEDYVRMTEDEEDIAEVIPTTTAPLPTTVVHQNVAESRRHYRRRNRHRGRAMQRMYNTCACCYLLSVIVVTVVTLGLIYYFPHPPTFNVCNDEVAWKSVMESVTAAKVDAEIQLLTSIANPNRLSVLLVDGTGSLTHDGELVGTLTFPPSTIADMAITDILVVASFTPERWAALSIAKEFHKGTLVLSLEVDLTLKVPALFNYERTISVQKQLVQVNTKADRSLCACPTWSDLKSQRTPWMQATLD